MCYDFTYVYIWLGVIFLLTLVLIALCVCTFRETCKEVAQANSWRTFENNLSQEVQIPKSSGLFLENPVEKYKQLFSDLKKLFVWPSWKVSYRRWDLLGCSTLLSWGQACKLVTKRHQCLGPPEWSFYHDAFPVDLNIFASFALHSSLPYPKP